MIFQRLKPTLLCPAIVLVLMPSNPPPFGADEVAAILLPLRLNRDSRSCAPNSSTSVVLVDASANNGVARASASSSSVGFTLERRKKEKVRKFEVEVEFSDQYGRNFELQPGFTERRLRQKRPQCERNARQMDHQTRRLVVVQYHRSLCIAPPSTADPPSRFCTSR
mmetsp:Transcript_2316/g.6213  ORF Transcript_2316/g.6213 Transcript_2316/m.6213 type:complete len:166 (+) Transcript_2316:392-889(+)